MFAEAGLGFARVGRALCLPESLRRSAAEPASPLFARTDSEGCGGDACFGVDEGVAVQFDVDSVAVEDEYVVGERGAAVGDEVDGAVQRDGQDGGVDCRVADDRGRRARSAVGFEYRGEAGFLDRGETGGELLGDVEFRLVEPGLRAESAFQTSAKAANSPEPSPPGPHIADTGTLPGSRSGAVIAGPPSSPPALRPSPRTSGARPSRSSRASCRASSCTLSVRRRASACW